MNIKFISYGYKYYEAEGLAAPEHDFLFNLRDLNNPYWIPELKPFCGLDSEILDFFERDSATQERLRKISDLVKDFINDFLTNERRTLEGESGLIFAFRCTGGKHRSVYFADLVYKYMVKAFHTEPELSFAVEHIDLPRYIEAEKLAKLLGSSKQ
jgi:UPF0042 nucleotide-binding protein